MGETRWVVKGVRPGPRGPRVDICESREYGLVIAADCDFLREEDADLIVRAVNAHDALVEALEEAEAGLDIAVQTILATDAPDWPESSPRKALAIVRAALALARGETADKGEG